MRRILGSLVALVLAVTVPSLAAQSAQSSNKSTSTKTVSGPVNLNTASQSDLEALPGVGPATAKKIIAGRPYASVADLSKAGVPKATIDKISGMVTVAGTAPSGAPAPAAAQTTRPASPAAAAPAPHATASNAAAQQPPQKGMVWVNLDTKVFHREGDRYYGKTKNGKFMTEADAVAAGYREAKSGGAKSTKK